MKKYLLPSLLSLPVVAAAEVTDAAGVIRVVEKIGDWIYSAFVIIAVVMIVITAFQFLFAQGDAAKYSKAKLSLLYAAIAVAVAALAKGFVAISQSIVS